MTLEDFFTLTEMKDGLTAPARVRELVNVMQKQKDSIVKNVGDATRQWSTVASTIAATEDKDCLDLFIQLDGLWFIDRWLKDAQKFGNDPSDSFLEESITALLRAVEKLHIDHEKSMFYGIWMTVKNLLGHSSYIVQHSASVLFDSWKQDGDSDGVPRDVETVGASPTDGIKGRADLAGEGGHPDCSSRDISLSEEGSSEGKHVEPARDELMPSESSDAFQTGRVEDVRPQTSDKEKSFDYDVIKDECSSDPVGSSIILEPIEEKISIKEKSLVEHSEESGSMETCSFVVPNRGIDGKLDVPKLNQYTDIAKQMQVAISPNKGSTMVISSVSSIVETGSLSSDAAANAQESAREPDLQNKSNTTAKDRLKGSPICDMRMGTSEEKSGMDDGSPQQCGSMVVFQNKGNDCVANISVDSSGNDDKLRKLEDSDTSFSIDGDKEYATDESENLVNDSSFSKPAMNAKDPDVVDKRSSDLELEYGIVDALEVARQVAIEVEREVEDRRERSCSSSEKILGGGIRQPDSPESIHGKEIQPIEMASKEVPTGNMSPEASPKREELLGIAKIRDAETENCAQDMESSQVTEAAQEPEVNAERGLGDFDLNQEVCSEDMDRPVNGISTPISVVSASRAAAAPGLPVAPLQFEGAHGWKGSAATSAFRPASPRRFTDGDKTLVVGGSHSSSKQRQDFLDIDLNVADAGDDKILSLNPGKQILVPSGFPLGESSARPRRSEGLKLDLNRISDDDDAPSDWRMEGRVFHQRNGHHSPSPSSSSSSMQPALRNIDLNDQPSFGNDSSRLQPYLGTSSSLNLNASGRIKPDDSVISIMGTRVEVNRKDFVHRTLPFPNGRILEPALDFNLARSGGFLGMGSAAPYARPPVFGYNAPTTGTAVSFSSPMYGPGGHIPYMVDSRGAPVVPQIMGSASASPATYSQPPFLVSMFGTPPGSNGAGPSRPNFDLNSGFMFDGGNRESGGSRHLYSSGQVRLMGEHLTANSQSASDSGGVGKRKEPEGGWEPYPYEYRRQPPWK